MNYRAACLSPSICRGICLFASDFICRAAVGRWGTSAAGAFALPDWRFLCPAGPLQSQGTIPVPGCPSCPWSLSRCHHLPPVLWCHHFPPILCTRCPSLGRGHHSRARQLKPFSLHSLLIFLYFWLCFRSKILFAVHHLASLAPGQHARLQTRALTKVRSSSDLRPSCKMREGGTELS